MATRDRTGQTFKNADGGREIVDAAGGLESSGQDLDRGHKIVSEAIVQVALKGKEGSAGRCDGYFRA